jgi:hypothetical protein
MMPKMFTQPLIIAFGELASSVPAKAESTLKIDELPT